MKIEINTPNADVPEHIIRYIKEMVRLAKLQDNGIDNAYVTLKETIYFDANWYICELGFTFQGQSFLITKKASSYFIAAYDASQDLFTKIRNNSSLNYH